MREGALQTRYRRDDRSHPQGSQTLNFSAEDYRLCALLSVRHWLKTRHSPVGLVRWRTPRGLIVEPLRGICGYESLLTLPVTWSWIGGGTTEVAVFRLVTHVSRTIGAAGVTGWTRRSFHPTRAAIIY
jgi:hypothetical protein